MPISKSDLVKMNELLSSGATIAELYKNFIHYDYWEIYWTVNDYSLLGKKRSITNRLKKLKHLPKKEDRNILIDEIQSLIDDIYEISKNNGKKLLEIDKALRKRKA